MSICNIHSTFSWGEINFEPIFKKANPFAKEAQERIHFSCIKAAKCSNCKRQNYWVTVQNTHNPKKWEMIYPSIFDAPLPSKDLPEICKQYYLEAAEIAQKSSRGAGALLRLCIQKLCDELGEKNKDLSVAIGDLVKNKNLDKKIQQSLDIVRVIGNNAVHPGQICVDDKPELVQSLFKLVNLIVKEVITIPKEVDEMYNSLPENTLKGISERDKK